MESALRYQVQKLSRIPQEMFRIANGEGGEEDPGGGDAGLNRVKYCYRLTPPTCFAGKFPAQILANSAGYQKFNAAAVAPSHSFRVTTPSVEQSDRDGNDETGICRAGMPLCPVRLRLFCRQQVGYSA